jgi:hypothetical protein
MTGTCSWYVKSVGNTAKGHVLVVHREQQTKASSVGVPRCCVPAEMFAGDNGGHTRVRNGRAL